ncbi:MAG: PilZ domain-containing protein [Planctomycetaceae bacterium]
MKDIAKQPTTKVNSAPIDLAQRPFQPNIEGLVARLQLGGGRVLFCDAVVLTTRDLVVVVPKSEGFPDRGEEVRCSLFLTDDDSYVAHREGTVHWEMAVHGERMAAVFFKEATPKELLDLTPDEQRRGVRFPANVACAVNGKVESTEGRLINYSLDGFATQLPEPMTIGEIYNVQVEAGDDNITIEGLCRWNIKTAYGFINGCSCENEDGYKLARRDFRGSVMPWDINRTRSSNFSDLNDDDDEPEATASGSKSDSTQRPLISSTTILILSITLLGLALRTPDGGNTIAFLTGCLGIVMFIGLQWTAKIRVMVMEQIASTRTREHAENRLNAHISAERNSTK